MMDRKWDIYLRARYADIVRFEMDRMPGIWQWAGEEVERWRVEAERAERLKAEQIKKDADEKAAQCCFGCCGNHKW